ncbi:MAG: nitroreductase family protein [Thermoanaerobaculia bacterium]
MTFPTIPYEAISLPDADALARVREFAREVNARRSVRDFSPEPVPVEIIEEAVRAAGCAPSGANIQPWSFVVVSDPETKRKIREAAEKEEYENYHGRMPEPWLEDLRPLQTDWKKPFLEVAPHLVVVFRQDYRGMPDGKRRPNYYIGESVGIACGFFLVAIHRAGLVALTHTPSPMGFLSQILGRPKNEKPYLLIPVGRPAPGARVPDIRRKALSEILSGPGPRKGAFSAQS